jgi:hypothetical protein
MLEDGTFYKVEGKSIMALKVDLKITAEFEFSHLKMGNIF